MTIFGGLKPQQEVCLWQYAKHCQPMCNTYGNTSLHQEITPHCSWKLPEAKCSYYGVAMQLLEICLYQPACPRQLLLTSNDVLDVMAAVSIRLEQMWSWYVVPMWGTGSTKLMWTLLTMCIQLHYCRWWMLTKMVEVHLLLGLWYRQQHIVLPPHIFPQLRVCQSYEKSGNSALSGWCLSHKN